MSRNFNRRPRQPDPWNGLLLVDKPADWTSHDVVAKVRNHFRFDKTGHGGTLDPMATGLLVLLIGKGTRLSQQVMVGRKEYEGTLRLGCVTDTQDREGQVLEEHDPSGVTRAMLEAEVARWQGDIEQIPPMVSAIKKDGVPLYKMARSGKEIEREPRPLSFYEFELLDYRPPLVDFRLLCSKGTYVRTLAHDIGAALGCGGCLQELRRTASGAFRVDQAFTLEEILRHDRESIRELIRHMADLKPEDFAG